MITHCINYKENFSKRSPDDKLKRLGFKKEENDDLIIYTLQFDSSSKGIIIINKTEKTFTAIRDEGGIDETYPVSIPFDLLFIIYDKIQEIEQSE